MSPIPRLSNLGETDEIQVEDVRICEICAEKSALTLYSGGYDLKQERGVHHCHQLYAETWVLAATASETGSPAVVCPGYQKQPGFLH